MNLSVAKKILASYSRKEQKLIRKKQKDQEVQLHVYIPSQTLEIVQ